MLIYYQKVI